MPPRHGSPSTTATPAPPSWLLTCGDPAGIGPEVVVPGLGGARRPRRGRGCGWSREPELLADVLARRRAHATARAGRGRAADDRRPSDAANAPGRGLRTRARSPGQQVAAGVIDGRRRQRPRRPCGRGGVRRGAGGLAGDRHRPAPQGGAACRRLRRARPHRIARAGLRAARRRGVDDALAAAPSRRRRPTGGLGVVHATLHESLRTGGRPALDAAASWRPACGSARCSPPSSAGRRGSPWPRSIRMAAKAGSSATRRRGSWRRPSAARRRRASTRRARCPPTRSFSARAAGSSTASSRCTTTRGTSRSSCWACIAR